MGNKKLEALNDYREVIKANILADRIIFGRLLYENGRTQDAVFGEVAVGSN